MKRHLLFPLAAALLMLASTSCTDAASAGSNTTKTSSLTGGQLPAQTPELLDEEWSAFRKLHPELSEDQAKTRFRGIQVMSAKAREQLATKSESVSAWAERRALANRWLKTKIEDVYSPQTVTDGLVQAGLDAYAFESGHPALVTASHVLIKDDGKSSQQERLEVMQQIHQKLSGLRNISNDDISAMGVELLRAGYDADVNLNLEFPRYPMQSFMGEQLPYHAVVEPFAAAAFALSNDHPLSPVTESEFGYHIILFQSRTSEKKPAIDDIRDFMVSKIVAYGRTAAMSNAVANLWDSARIEVNEQLLKTMSTSDKQ